MRTLRSAKTVQLGEQKIILFNALIRSSRVTTVILLHEDLKVRDSIPGTGYVSFIRKQP